MGLNHRKCACACKHKESHPDKHVSKSVLGDWHTRCMIGTAFCYFWRSSHYSKNFPTNRHAYHAASVYATWRTTARVIPELASYDLTDEPSSLPLPAAAFVTAYRSVIDFHTAVVTAYTAIDAVLLFLVTGGKRSNHRPSILPRRSHIPFPRKPL